MTTEQGLPADWPHPQSEWMWPSSRPAADDLTSPAVLLREAASRMRAHSTDAPPLAAAVALAVADWLEHAAARAECKIEHGGGRDPVWSHERDALAVARVFLGTDR